MSWTLPKSVVVDEMLYIQNRDGREELYNLAVDPAETTNLLDSVASRSDLERCRFALRHLIPDEIARR